MKHLFLLFCLLGPALTVRQDKKINLDDIEHDNLKSERKVKQEKQQAKTSAATTYIEQPQLEAAPQVSYVQQAPPPAAYIQQAYAPQAPPQYTFAPVKTVQQYAQQPQLYSRYELPVVADNSVAQPSYYTPQQQQQQYYSPQQQYVYLQPAGAAQVEPRATIQYVMYVPAPVAAAQPAAATYVASPKTETLLQSAQEYLNALPPPQAYAAAQEYSYDVPAAAAPQRYVQQQQPQPQPQLQYTYIQQEPPQVSEPSSPDTPSSHHNHHQQQTVEQQYVQMAPAQPKSLLDSYVPSYLQVQYFKQQQQSQKNSIQEQGKGGLSSITGKTDIVKSQHGSASSYKYQYQIPEY